MLDRKINPATQIAACGKEMAEMATAWRALARFSETKARTQAEVQVFNQMVVALEGWFAGGLRRVDATDGQVLHEVRLLALGVTHHNGWFPADPTIQWSPEASVTGYSPGDRIAIDETVFSRLAVACLDAVAAKVATS